MGGSGRVLVTRGRIDSGDAEGGSGCGVGQSLLHWTAKGWVSVA